MARLIEPPRMAPIDPMGTLADIMHLASAGQQFKTRRADEDSRKALESALGASGGNVSQAIATLEQQGRWNEAGLLRKREGEIKTEQQKALAESLKAAREGFETSTRYLQGVEAATTPEEKSAMFTAVRPRIVEALPGIAQYIPERLEDDPNFLTKAIPFGLSASDVAKRRGDAVDQLNASFAQAGEKFDRDKEVLAHLGPWLETAESGEEVAQIISTAKDLYGASDAIVQRIGEVPAGPLDDAWRTGINARLRGATKTSEGSDFEKFVRDKYGNAPTAAQRLQARSAWAAAGREPDAPSGLGGPSSESRAVAERWKQGALDRLEARYRASQTGEQVRDDAGNLITIPKMSAADLQLAKDRIQASYIEQIGASSPSKATSRTSPDAAGRQAGAVPKEVSAALKGQKPGRYKLSDGSSWTVAADGAISPAN